MKRIGVVITILISASFVNMVLAANGITYSDNSFTAFQSFITEKNSPPPLLDPSRLSFEEVATGLNNPVFITHPGDGSGRMFVVERGGRIRIIKNGTLLVTPFLDIQSFVKSTYGEQG